MAVIKCPECKGKVSSTLSVCPHCGHVFGKETTKKVKSVVDDKKTIAYRDHCGQALSYIFGGIGVAAIIMFVIWSINGLFDADTAPAAKTICFIVLTAGLILIALSIPLGSYANKNNALNDKCIVYNSSNKTFTLFLIDGHTLDIRVDQFVSFNKNFGKKFKLTYKDEYDLKHTVDIGCVKDRFSAMNYIEALIKNERKEKK